MSKATELLQRLDAIGRSLAASGHGRALLGVGSVGLELDRLDAYSDLDFFAIVEDGYQAAYVADLGWLECICPIAYRVQNEANGHKVLFADGIFCEFAVFGEAELAGLPFALPPARVVWKADGVDPAIGTSYRAPAPITLRPPEVLLGEAVTNLYVGLGRYHRGERLTAMRFIQVYAVDRILELAPQIETEQAAHRDPFGNDRRVERRFPTLAQELPRFTQGYDRSVESAAAILGFLERHWEVNPAIRQAILTLMDPAEAAIK